ncbi:MAG: hypothetical protein AAEJ04_07995 [Planctomycetota bacterium]
MKIEVHGSGILAYDLGSNKLPERGSITQRLTRGIIDSTGAECWFVISDASDKSFCEEFGGSRASALEDAPDSAVNDAYLEDGVWHFPEDAGLTTRFSSSGTTVLSPVANPDYSPLKRFVWDGEEVTANMPLVVWGTEPGQRLLIDQGGCDPLIRSNPPSPFFVGGGPAGANCSEETPYMRYKGGQALAIDLVSETVTMKLHKATYKRGVIPYYTVFEASKAPPAGFMGVPYAPKLSNLGRFEDDQGVGLIVQFGNGVPVSDGGPNRFQPGIANYPGGQSKNYTPMWVIMFAYFTDGINAEDMFITEYNVGEGAIPSANSGLPGFDPTSPEDFDPFQIRNKGADLTEFARNVTGNDDGVVERLGDLFDLVDDGDILLTEAPGGLRRNSPLQPSLIVNCPVPITVKD